MRPASLLNLAVFVAAIVVIVVTAPRNSNEPVGTTGSQRALTPAAEAPKDARSNIASAARGSRAIASDSQSSFPAVNLNDGTDAPWGSVEGQTDVYAGVLLPTATVVHEIQIQTFSPGGHAHLHDIRIVTADSEGPAGQDWKFVRARLKGSNGFNDRLTVPALADGSRITIELDSQDPHFSPHVIWGFACLRSKGDTPNYVSVGTGVYVREIEMR